MNGVYLGREPTKDERRMASRFSVRDIRCWMCEETVLPAADLGVNPAVESIDCYGQLFRREFLEWP